MSLIPIQPKRSYTATAVPKADEIEVHELVINWADGKAFTKDASGQIFSVTMGGGGPVVDSRWDLFLAPAPTGLAASAGNGQVALTWAAPSVLAQTPITDYAIQFSGNGGTSWTTFSDGVSTNTAATVTGLANGTAYTFRVAAVTGVGTGAYSATAAATPATAAFVPSFISGLQAWYDASDATTLFDATSGGSPVAADGGVARWEDKSGNARHMTQGTSGSRPTRKTAIQNSLAVLRFDGGDFVSMPSSTATFNFLHNGDSTVFVVFKAGTTANPESVYVVMSNNISDGSIDDKTGFYLRWDDRTWADTALADALIHVVSNSGQARFVGRATNGFPANTFALATVRGDIANATIASRSQIRRNGGNEIPLTTSDTSAEAALPTANASDNFTIGHQSGAVKGNGLNGDIAEIIMYDTALSNTDRAAVESYLMTKWGINAPTSLAATAGNAQLALSWTAPVAPGPSAITGYRVEYTPSGGAAQTVNTGSTSTSYTLTGLTNGTSYSVRVAAVNSSGAGAYSSATAATPAQSQPDEHWPSVRVLLRMEGSDGGTVFTNTASTPITVTRSASAVTSTNAARFGSSGLGGGWLQLSDGGGSGSAFNVGLNWTLEAWVKFNTLSASAAGNGIFSLWDNGQGALASLRLLQSGVAIVAGQWNDNSQPIVANTWHHVALVREGYYIKSFIDGQLVLNTDLGGAAPFLQTSIFLLRDPSNSSGPADAVMDEFRFTRDVARYSANFTPPTAAFPEVGTPTANAPASLAATAGNAQLSLSWTAPAYAGTSSITGYRVEYTPSGGAAQTVNTGSTSTSYTLTGLTNGTSYSVRVAAVNSSGAGTYSQAATGTPNATALTPLSGLTNNGTVSGSGTAASPLVWAGSIKWGGVSGSTEGAASAFTVQASGTLYINVTSQDQYCGDSDIGSEWYKNGVSAGLSGWCRASYTGSFAVAAGDTISVRYAAFYDAALKGFSAYVA